MEYQIDQQPSNLQLNKNTIYQPQLNANLSDHDHNDNRLSKIDLVLELEKNQNDGLSDTSSSDLEIQHMQEDHDELKSNVDKFKTKNELRYEKQVQSYRENTKQETKQQRIRRYGLDKLESHKQCGVIQSICEGDAIIKGVSNMVLNLDTVIVFCKEQEIEILGKVEDVMGNIDCPFYRVVLDYYILQNWIDWLNQGQSVSILSQQNVIRPEQIHQIMKQKGCDASNRFDEELEHFSEEDDDDDADADYNDNDYCSQQYSVSNSNRKTKKQQKIENKRNNRQKTEVQQEHQFQNIQNSQSQQLKYQMMSSPMLNNQMMYNPMLNNQMMYNPMFNNPMMANNQMMYQQNSQFPMFQPQFQPHQQIPQFQQQHPIQLQQQQQLFQQQQQQQQQQFQQQLQQNQFQPQQQQQQQQNMNVQLPISKPRLFKE